MAAEPVIRVSIGPAFPTRDLPLSHALSVALELQNSGRLSTAADVYAAILEVVPDSFDALHLSGVLSYQAGDNERAVRKIEHALKVKPDSADALTNLAFSLNGLGQYDKAKNAADAALRIAPDLPQAHRALAAAALHHGQLRKAYASYEAARSLAPNHPQTLTSLGAIALKLGHLQLAEQWIKRAVNCQADAEQHAEIMLCQGALDLARGDPAAALHAFESVADAMADNSQWWYQRSVALEELGRWDEALAAAQRALDMHPEHGPTLSDVMFLRRRLCQWPGHDGLLEQFRAALAGGMHGLKPFSFLCEPATLEEQKRCAVLWAAQVEERAAAIQKPRGASSRASSGSGRLRVGYLSNGFRRHPTAALCVELFERHDTDRFEIFGYSTGANDASTLRQRLEAACSHFRDVAHQSLEAVARQIEADQLDILVDLRGYGGGGMPELFALRLVPIQVQFFAYPGTMGANFMDYLITDPFVVPSSRRSGYTEKLAQLPIRFQPNDTTRTLAKRMPTRAECGLPPEGLVLCSFNNSYKITDTMFDCWLRLLNSQPGSVLWLLSPPAGTSVPGTLKTRAQQAGVDPDRLIFMPKLPHMTYLSRYRLVDLFLDTYPYNAHTTASDALWAGCPILTLAGDTFASRVAGSLLHAAGLPELITYSLAEYEDKARSLLDDPAELSRLRSAVAAARTGPLFDTTAFARSLESAFQAMVERHRRGQAPADLTIEA